MEEHVEKNLEEKAIEVCQQLTSMSILHTYRLLDYGINFTLQYNGKKHILTLSYSPNKNRWTTHSGSDWVKSTVIPIVQSLLNREATSTKQRKANARQSKWAFAELHSMIAYKSLLRESMTVKVDAHFTSQACPVCGHTSKENRPRKGLLFVCQNCQYTLHADLIGARNVSLRTLLIRQDWMSTGVLSVRPDVSDNEAKALRLQRYSELRWSSDTSPRIYAWGY